jgi:hypothetical protein
MKKSSSIALISGSVLAGIVALVPMTSPVVAQTTTPGTGTGTTGTQQPRTTTTYEREQDNSGLWGLAGLVGLAGLLGRKKEEDRPARRDDAPVYRDPNVR